MNKDYYVPCPECKGSKLNSENPCKRCELIKKRDTNTAVDMQGMREARQSINNERRRIETMKEYDINKIWDGNYGAEIHFKGKIEITHEVIEAIDDDWRKSFYSDLITPQDIAEHIAFNIIVNEADLSRLDGFANFPDEYAHIVGYEFR